MLGTVDEEEQAGGQRARRERVDKERERVITWRAWDGEIYAAHKRTDKRQTLPFTPRRFPCSIPRGASHPPDTGVSHRGPDQPLTIRLSHLTSQSHPG